MITTYAVHWRLPCRIFGNNDFFLWLQNHVNERKIKRQDVEQATLVEALSDAELREKELHNSIVELQRKLSNTESKVRPVNPTISLLNAVLGL